MMSVKNPDINLLNEKSALECLRLISDGSGIGYLNGLATFVPGLLPGETADVEVEEVKKKWQRARIKRIIKQSPQRINAPCTVFEECGGCQLQHTTYEETLLWKQYWVKDALLRIGKINVGVKPTLGMLNPWRYRNKARLHREPSGEIGYYKEKSKDLVHFHDCLLLSERMNHWIHLTEELLAEGERYTDIHTLTLRENTYNEGLLLLEGSSSNINMLEKNFDFLNFLAKEGICAVWGLDKQGSLKRLWGDETFNQTILDITYGVSPLSFLQVNSPQTNVLYANVLDMAALTGEEIVCDLYSGIGTLALALAPKAKKVTGIEENPFAVEDAIRNIERNNMVGHVEFIQGKVEQELLKIPEQPDVIVLDPPRAGVHADVLNRLLKVKPKRIIYVSCDPGTLARDLGLLTAGEYGIASVQPVDMFPWTQHVETVVRLDRKHS